MQEYNRVNDKKNFTDEQIINFLKKFYHFNPANLKIDRTKKFGIVCSVSASTDENFNVILYDDRIFIEYGSKYDNIELAYLKTMLENFKDDDEFIKHIMNRMNKARDEEIQKHKKKMEKFDADEKYLFGDTLENLAKAGEQMQTANAEGAEQTSVFDSGEQLTITGTDEQQPH